MLRRGEICVLFAVIVQNCSARLAHVGQAYVRLAHPRSNLPRTEELALASCNKYSQSIAHAWQKNLSASLTTWKLPSVELTLFMRRNMIKNLKSNVLVRELGEETLECLCPHLLNHNLHYLASWIILDTTEEHEFQDSPENRTSYKHIQCPPDRAYQKDPISLPVLYFKRNDVPSLESFHDGEEPATLRNTEMNVGCVDCTPRNSGLKPDCNSWQADIIFEGAAMHNVTVTKSFYRSHRDVTQEMFDGNIDVLGGITVVYPEVHDNFTIPPVVALWYESFYAKRRDPQPLSFYAILEESHIALLFVAFTLLGTLTVLVAADTQRICDISLDYITVSASFLLASFYGTSSRIPRMSRFGTVSTFLCGLWLIGILPFSNYFRGELTSRVTLRTTPEQLDNIGKLERALDEGAVAPCVTGNTYLQGRLLDPNPTDSVHSKLHVAFMKKKDRMGLTVPDFHDCLLCAHRTDRICFSYSLPRWHLLYFKRGLVESTEPLSVLYMTVTVRKNYRHKTALNKIIRRVIETSLLRQPEDFAKMEYLRSHADESDSMPCPFEVNEFASFFLVFSALLGVSIIVLAFKLIIARKKCCYNTASLTVNDLK